MKKLIPLGFAPLLCALVCSLVWSCQNSNIDYKYPENPKNIRNERAGKFFDNKNIFGTKKEQPSLENQSNTNQLWLASIEVISVLLPIETADENSGLIATEWYQDGQNNNARIKINLMVKGSEAVKENLDLTVLRQIKNNQGIWVDDNSNNQSTSSQMIRDKIIQQAKAK